MIECSNQICFEGATALVSSSLLTTISFSADSFSKKSLAFLDKTPILWLYFLFDTWKGKPWAKQLNTLERLRSQKAILTGALQ